MAKDNKALEDFEEFTRYEMRKALIFPSILLIIAIGLALFLIVLAVQYNQTKCDACKMCNINESQLTTVGGVFYPDKGFYCVYTEGKNAVEINDIVEHEKCHALIHLDNVQHFCKVKNNE